MLAGVWWREKSGEGHVQILVLGDAGRSPRMQYHCRSLLQFKYSVELVGYGGEGVECDLESVRVRTWLFRSCHECTCTSVQVT